MGRLAAVLAALTMLAACGSGTARIVGGAVNEPTRQPSEPENVVAALDPVTGRLLEMTWDLQTFSPRVVTH